MFNSSKFKCTSAGSRKHAGPAEARKRRGRTVSSARETASNLPNIFRLEIAVYCLGGYS